MRKIEQCVVCGDYRHCEMHHIKPGSMGGKMTVPLCLSCHEQIDRTPLGDWDAGEAFGAMSGLWNKCSKPERLLLLKFLSVMSLALTETADA